ncbi:hypothetical protein, partial [Phocaeicola sp.]
FRSFRGRPLLLFAAGFFLSLLFPLAFLCFFCCSPGRPSEVRLEAFSTERRVISSPELSDALKTYENQSEKGIILKIYLFAIGVVLLGLSDMFGGM